MLVDVEVDVDVVVDLDVDGCQYFTYTVLVRV
jgi:hypothetical protein